MNKNVIGTVLSGIIVCFVIAILYYTNNTNVKIANPVVIMDKHDDDFLSIDTINPIILKRFIQGVNPKVYDNLAKEIIDASIRISRKYRLSAILVLAVAKTESEFNINAVSTVGARGLMQINPNVWKDSLIKGGIISNEFELHDPVKNIEAGCYILRTYLDQTKSFNKALNEYLGADSARYRAEIDRQVGGILMLGISTEINAPYR